MAENMKDKGHPMNTTPIDNKIEFMAWDVVEEKIRRVSRLDYPEWTVCVIDDLYNFQCERNSFKNRESDRFMLMQRTALRSINDEPIYNHMIVRDESGILRIVDMFDYNQMYFLSGRALEIVGNRFQHPELLELCK